MTASTHTGEVLNGYSYTVNSTGEARLGEERPSHIDYFAGFQQVFASAAASAVATGKNLYWLRWPR